MAYQRKYRTNNNKKYQKKELPRIPRFTCEWSDLQKAIFSDVGFGSGNTQVNAYAGTGKTTTLVEALYHVSHVSCKALMCAFNKDIKIEMSRRVPNSVDTATIHSLGFSAAKNAFGKNCCFDANKTKGYIYSIIGEEREKFELRNAVDKAVGLAKGYLADTPEKIEEIMDRHDIDSCGETSETFCGMVLNVMEATKKDTNRVDYNDMIWLPLVYDCSFTKYGLILVDEAQDLNASQIEVVMRSLAENGRIISCGDRRQAIYGWRGADRFAIDNIVKRCNSKELPLSITYRCAKNIVAMVKYIVPGLEAHESAPEGIVEDMSPAKMVSNAGPGDFVLSRTNAPLIKYCLAFLKAGVPANIKGRDVGEQLTSLIKKSNTKDIPSLLSWLDAWAMKERMRLAALKRDSSLLDDKVECLVVLSENVDSIPELNSNIDRMFYEGNDHDRVILSSTHKAKGLERDRVWMLKNTYHPEKGDEEENLFYVACTRAKKCLYMVG